MNPIPTQNKKKQIDWSASVSLANAAKRAFLRSTYGRLSKQNAPAKLGAASETLALQSLRHS